MCDDCCRGDVRQTRDSSREARGGRGIGTADQNRDLVGPSRAELVAYPFGNHPALASGGQDIRVHAAEPHSRER